MRFIYPYVSTTPPAPFALVRLANPNDPLTTVDPPAKVDSGADRTVIPVAVVRQLALDEVDRLVFAGLGGQQVTLPVYRTPLTVRDFPAVVPEVAASDGEPHVLLGRDVLNRYLVLLDGPSLRMEISDN